MLADGTTAVRSIREDFGISRLRRQLFKKYTISCVLKRRLIRLPLVEWSGRAPALPAQEAGKGRSRQEARHVSETQRSDRHDRHRYRQERVPRRGS